MDSLGSTNSHTFVTSLAPPATIWFLLYPHHASQTSFTWLQPALLLQWIKCQFVYSSYYWNIINFVRKYKTYQYQLSKYTFIYKCVLRWLELIDSDSSYWAHNSFSISMYLLTVAWTMTIKMLGIHKIFLQLKSLCTLKVRSGLIFW